MESSLINELSELICSWTLDIYIFFGLTPIGKFSNWRVSPQVQFTMEVGQGQEQINCKHAKDNTSAFKVHGKYTVNCFFVMIVQFYLKLCISFLLNENLVNNKFFEKWKISRIKEMSLEKMIIIIGKLVGSTLLKFWIQFLFSMDVNN